MSALEVEIEAQSYDFAARDPNLARVVRAIEGMARSLPWVDDAHVTTAIAVIAGWRRAAMTRLAAAGLESDEARFIIDSNEVGYAADICQC